MLRPFFESWYLSGLTGLQFFFKKAILFRFTLCKIRHYMKNLLWPLLLTVSALPSLCQINNSQNDSSRAYRLPYKIWVFQYDQPVQQVGLYTTTDSSIIFLKTLNWFDENTPKEEISIKNITMIKYRKKNRVGRKIGQGILIGFAAGAVYGALAHKPTKDPNWVQSLPGSMLSMGGVGAFWGLCGGLISGSVRTTIPIARNLKNYKAQREQLRRLGVHQN
jgi:hypothetical protein